MKDFFISFAEPGKSNLGVVVTTANNPRDALTKVTALKLNPGGEAAIWQMDKEEADKLGRDRLISSNEMRNGLGYRSNKDVSPDERRKFLDGATKVCTDCNELLRA